MQIKVPKSEVQCPRCGSTNSRVYLQIFADPDKPNSVTGIRCTQCSFVFHVDETVTPNAIQSWIYNKVFSGQSDPSVQPFKDEVGSDEKELARKIAKIMIVAQGIGVNFGDLMFLALAETEGGLE